jgi:uncharacterized Tic20 family protein
MTESNIPPTPPPSDTPAIGYASPVVGYDGPPPTKDETNMGMLIFILGIVTGFVGPLILWLLKKAESRYIDAQGKEVLNFQITTILALIVNIPLFFIFIGILTHFAIVITYLVLMIIGAVQASKGGFYRFPFALRLLK